MKFSYHKNGNNNHIIEEYSKYPKMKYYGLELKKDVKKYIFENSDEGFSFKSLFLYNEHGLIDTKLVLKFFNLIFGEYNKKGKMVTKNIKKNNVFIEKYKNHAQKNSSVSIKNSSDPNYYSSFFAYV